MATKAKKRKAEQQQQQQQLADAEVQGQQFEAPRSGQSQRVLDGRSVCTTHVSNVAVLAMHVPMRVCRCHVV